MDCGVGRGGEGADEGAPSGEVAGGGAWGGARGRGRAEGNPAIARVEGPPPVAVVVHQLRHDGPRPRLARARPGVAKEAEQLHGCG